MALFKKKKGKQDKESEKMLKNKSVKDTDLSASSAADIAVENDDTSSPKKKEKNSKKDKTKKTKDKKKEIDPEVKRKKAEQTKKNLGLALRIMIVITLVAAVVTGAFVLTRFILLPSYQKYRIRKELKKAEEPPPENPPKKNPPMGIIYEIRDITVNTYASQGHRFVVVEMALETHNTAVIDELESREPQIRDLLIKYLRSYTAEQILDLDFQEYSRGVLTDLINQRLSSGKVDSLYYTMLVVQ